MAKQYPDKLSQEAAMARSANMSYGKWKAMQTPTVIEPKKPKECFIKRICPVCNVEFIAFDNKHRVVCGDRCRKLYRSEYNQKRRLERLNKESDTLPMADIIKTKEEIK